jgi:hypothetical protein
MSHEALHEEGHMGDSQAWEAYEGRNGPPTFAEMFKSARRPRYRTEALRLLKKLDLDAAADELLRRKLAEAWRISKILRATPAMLAEFKRRERRFLKTETGLTNLLPLFHTPPEPLVAARDFLRTLPPRPRLPKGRQPLPFLAKVQVDLGLEPSEARTLLRAAGIPLSTGRPPRL